MSVKSKDASSVTVVKIFRRDLPRFHAFQSRLEVLRKKKLVQPEVMREILDSLEAVV